MEIEQRNAAHCALISMLALNDPAAELLGAVDHA